MAKESNQAEVLTEGHVPNGPGSDPYASASQGMSIGLSTNFGIEHYGVIAGMHEGSGPSSVGAGEE